MAKNKVAPFFRTRCIGYKVSTQTECLPTAQQTLQQADEDGRETYEDPF